MLEDEMWNIRYLVVDTGPWILGKKVLVALDWVEKIDWSKRDVFVNLSKEQIKNSPEFDPAKPVNRVYEETLYDFYGRPRYWA